MEKQADVEQRLCYEEEDGYDAVVVGSGYGGSVASFRMSMAGIKVCLLEKGRRWEAHDFPTDSLKILSALRLENRNLGVSLGPNNALFQLYEQGDSLAAIACGLGGGSLVNAGVTMPTPVRARRNLKWPKEWERDWDSCEAFAAAMLRVQRTPVDFPVSKVMGEIANGEIEESSEDLIKLSINFDLEEPPSDLKKLQQTGNCLACGNCVAGCPYNAKNSTDKNYISAAIQAGCVVQTGCQVQYVVKNPYESHQEDKSSRKRRRWLVYLNEIDYVASDFVILSAGVFGTTEILFQSQMRGLELSEALGSGFSCNGNTVAYLAGSPAPLNAYGLDRKKILQRPFQERPGPTISSSHTSSLGFTIQSAVLPTAYPYLLFKGIASYGWPTGHWFFHGIMDKLKHVIGLKSSQAMVLNAMGYDDSDGKIMFDKATNKICFSPPRDPLLPRKIEAFQKLAKKLGGIVFLSKYRSTSVHVLGGCNASSDSSNGVCNSSGQVFDTKAPTSVHPGLYVCDASLIPCSVGINPSLTIAAAAEHVSKHLVKDVLEYKSKKGIGLAVETVNQYPKLANGKKSSVNRSMVLIKETMKGYIGGMPCTAYIKMKMNSDNQNEVNKCNSVIGDPHPLLKGKVGGYVVFKAIEKDRLHVIDGEVDLCKVDYRTPYTQYMHYRLLLASSSGSRYILEGHKIMNPYLLAIYAWKETTTLHVTFKNFSGKCSRQEMMNLTGELKISIIELLKSFIGLEGNGRRRFIGLLLQALLRTYILQIPRVNHKHCSLSDSYHKSYPESTLHEIIAEDGYIINCRQWKCSKTPLRFKGENQLNPVLLLNGYSGESYWLPTEPNDLVRTLLEEGHDIWLLQSRLHPSHPANDVTIEGIGRFDIPAAIGKILELHGKSRKVHVVAHCVGGLAIHMALMGGHLSSTHIASLSCINSSMFFRLNALSRFKMWLPLLPVSMAILGKNKILPLLETSKSSFRHQLLKRIACFIPRYERCTYKECEVFSGIFGNTFWHQNISPTMHHWLNMQSITRVPVAAFSHLRKICNSGFIVSGHGNNSYLIHPERMAVSTLYISGGRSLLVTPETSFLANKYMKLHQPSLRHERIVVEGFGHSDLLIGEESYKKVFPHILRHIKLAEQGENFAMGSRKKFNEEALVWEDDPYSEYTGFGSWFSPHIVVFILLFWLVILFNLFT